MNCILDTIEFASNMYLHMVGDESSTPDTVEFFIQVSDCGYEPIETDRDMAENLLRQHHKRTSVHGHASDSFGRNNPLWRDDNPTLDNWTHLAFGAN